MAANAIAIRAVGPCGSADVSEHHHHSPARRWSLWSLRSSAGERLVLALAVSGLLWLLGAWAMDWL